jgi:hypothetical protein
MASDEAPGKDPKPRFVGGPRAIGALLPAVTRPAFRSRSAASAQLLADWPEIVGPALSAVTQPRRLAGTSLTIACAGPVALELQHLTGPLAERINGHYGRILVQEFRFVQGAVTRPNKPPSRPTAPPVEIPDMAPSELRDALARLGAAILQARSREGA